VDTILGVVLILSGAILLLSGPRLARTGASVRSATEELSGPSAPPRPAERRAIWGAVALNEAIALLWIYLGIRFLTG
jgi:hypothetical protein